MRLSLLLRCQNSWNHFGCGVTEQDVRDTADAFVSTGMKDAGYTYVNVDDVSSIHRCQYRRRADTPHRAGASAQCWMAMNRTADGKLTHDPVRFPSGMKALAHYVQSKGLKFGLYSARCGKTCQGRPASQDHEWDDAFTFASWDVDCKPPAGPSCGVGLPDSF